MEQHSTIGILYPNNKNRSYRVNVRPPSWSNADKLWFGKIKCLKHAKMIADIALYLTGGTRDNNTEAYKKILPVDNDDLRSFRKREEFSEYVKSIAKGPKYQERRSKFKECLRKILTMAKQDFERQDYEEHAKFAKIVEEPLPLAASRSNGLPLPKLLAEASSSGSEGHCEDDTEVVDQVTCDESNYITNDMDEDANDASVGGLTSPEASAGDVCADKAVAAKVSGKVECQAKDESALLGMIAGPYPSYGVVPGFKMPIPGCFMDKGDEDLVYVATSNVPYFRPNLGNWHQFFTLISQVHNKYVYVRF